jgi:hypothetical protein
VRLFLHILNRPLEFCNTYTWQNVSNNFSVTHWRFPEVDYSRAKNNFIGVNE